MKKFSEVNILVIGDIVVDRFLWGVVSRISPEAPVPVVTVEKEEYMLGGAANVLQNIYALGSNAALCGVIGNDIVGDRVISILHSLSSPIGGIVKVANRLTTIKTRVIAQHQQVVRFDKEDIDEIDDKTLFLLSDYLEKNTDLFDVVVVSDYM
ncbi:MAG: D-glycero-beta-D-manno-heptose-7-phosphate kinase, partial [Gammaproteobacteria bacterium]|nr:D-glycero-beta-D-manno-heptose-7-phosphate kinase [Gammaproteobacteria bacterium]